MKALTVSTLFAIVVVSLTFLVSGGSYLDFLLPGGLPVGNALAAIGLACAAAIPVALSHPGSLLRAVAMGTLAAAATWLPVSIALAGNLSLNFGGVRGSIWLGFNLVLNIAVLFTLTWALVSHLVARRRARARSSAVESALRR